jgi:hypothetical protein
MLHIRLPRGLHDSLRAIAAEEGVSIQRLAEKAISDALTRATVPAEAGLLRTYVDRRDDRLRARLSELLAATERVDLAGLTLLDFLTDDGWGHNALRAAVVDRGVLARVAIQDRLSRAAGLRFASTYGLAADDEDALGATTKFLQLEYACKLLDALGSVAPCLNARQYAMPPTFRWLLVADSAVLAEPHVPRVRAGDLVSRALMPVFEFAPDSPAGDRLREHFDSLWRSIP